MFEQVYHAVMDPIITHFYLNMLKAFFKYAKS